MNMKCIHISLLIGLFLLNASASGADEEAGFISILKSNAGVPAKCAACFQLRRVGTDRSVPALARLLGQERCPTPRVTHWKACPILKPVLPCDRRWERVPV